MRHTLSSPGQKVKVSRETVSRLERLRGQMKLGSLEETISELIKNYRKGTLEGAFGADKGRVRSFDEDDRGEDR
ncbi:hypothetical protein AUF78_08310 [archaeon 13_1_20CM_2_51_12]|nr:MAG: hypothetical protein AUF78_08310 [archaeon 13_1_20CM_2_51_12]